MMSAATVESGLVSRLERLTGEGADCCVPGYQDLLKTVRRAPRFRSSLERARALGDESRLTAVAMLRRRRELCACEIQAALGLTHATVSHHMAVLEAAGLVASERRGKWMFYRLTSNRGAEIP
jgi:DNA-binding transcriptional ArsR family regulator